MSETLIAGTAATTTEGQTAATQATEASASTAGGTAEATQQAAAETATAAEATQAKTEEAAPAPAGAPEQYEAFKLPEGSAALSKETLSAFEGVARELNLPQDKAQLVIDKLAPALQAQNAADFEQAKTEWAGASTSDKEFGGDKLSENLAVAKKAVDQFASPELRSLLESSGFGNHPEVVRLFYRVGKQISEDGFVASGATQGTQTRNAASVLYDNTKS